MPKIDEYAEIVAGGGRYRFWKGVSVNRSYKDAASQMTIISAEPSTLPATWTSIKLKPGDPAQCYLAGELVITGIVTVRQAAYDKATHACQFYVMSKLSDAVLGTVEAKPGEYRNYALEQIAKAELGKLGIGFRVEGSPSGADKKFDRVNVQVGETVFELVDRLCRMRNLHLIDDENGDLVATRGGSSGSIADLVEGENILRASMSWNDQSAFNPITTTGDQSGSDRKWGDDCRANSATATNPHATRFRPLHILAEQPGDKHDMRMRCDHEVDLNVGGTLTAEITVQGWRRNGGSLWVKDVGRNVSVYSPMLFPQDKMTLGIHGVSHVQDNEQGSITVLSLVLPRANGSADKIPANGAPTAADPAKPDETN